jgi:hypothetical protein
LGLLISRLAGSATELEGGFGRKFEEERGTWDFTGRR